MGRVAGYLPVLIGAALLLLGSERQVVGQTKGKDKPLDFDRNIATILADRCLECHRGPGAEGQLDLSQEKTARQGGASGAALMGGDPGRSLAMQRVLADEMPPKHPLPAAEKEILRKWIEGGAPWGTSPIDPYRYSTARRAGYDWWSLQPIGTVDIPSLPGGAGRAFNPIDRFIRAKLSEGGLTPSPRAKPRDLVRRLFIDLTGLPPAPETVEQFARDPSQAAWENLAVTLLDSNAYGERWARHWLDAVRFGESSGYEYNQPRENAWRYRDWVTGALNADLPYDQFARMQIAGDLLRPNTLEGASAVGFLVAGTHNTVLGASPAMKMAGHQDELEEMAGTVAQTFLGLTVNCARCHDHKFDPITTREYYGFVAALDGVRPAEAQVPSPPAPAGQLEKLTRAKETLLQKLTDLVTARRGVVVASGTNRLRLKQPVAANQAGKPYRVSFSMAPSSWATAEQATGPEDGITVRLTRSDGTLVASRSAKPGPWAPGKNAARYQTETFEYAGDGQGDLVVELLPFPVQSNRFGGAVDDLSITDATTGQTLLTESFDTLRQHHPAGTQAETGRKVFFGATSERWAHAGTNSIHAEERAPGNLAVQLYGGGQGDLAILAETGAERALQTEMESLEAMIRSLPTQGTVPVYTVAAVNPGPTRVLSRGDVLRPGEEVAPAGLSAIRGLPATFHLDKAAADGPRRKNLAAWTSHPDNSLFLRVAVNRIWHHHFGSGLVNTPNDFGFGGGRPSHPELLDWLAHWFRENGYSMKKLHRLIVSSETYQQASLPNPTADRKDKDNRLLWRQNPRRVEGEVLRDSILAITGVLNREIYGPPFRDVHIVRVPPTHYYVPFEPVGDSANRRTLYRWQARGQRSALLDTFDCPDPSVKTPSRNVSTTPSQALSQWNNPFVLRMARLLAARVEREVPANLEGGEMDGSTALRVERAWRLVLGRAPAKDELEPSMQLVREQGMATLCRVLFNSNEFIVID